MMRTSSKARKVKSYMSRRCLIRPQRGRTRLQPNSVRHEICRDVSNSISCRPMKKKHSWTEALPKQRPGETPAPVVCGFKYLRLVGSLLQALHEAGTERDRAGNR